MGRIAYAQGEWETADHYFERSAGIFDVEGSQIEAGQTAYWHGLLLLSMNRSDEARKQLLAAQQIFAKLGANADLERTQAQLAELA